MKTSIKTLALALGATFALAVAVPARQAQTAAPGDSAAQTEQQSRRAERRARRHGKHARRHHKGIGGVRRQFAKLGLTDAQKQQMLIIAAQTKQATRAQREELFRIREARQPGVELTADQQARRQQLRGELRLARQQARAQMLATLTTEQRTQLEQRTQERQRRRAERRSSAASQVS